MWYILDTLIKAGLPESYVEHSWWGSSYGTVLKGECHICSKKMQHKAKKICTSYHRPIYWLNAFSKISEEVTYNRVRNFLN
jgi:hypothetical protein